MGTNFHSTALQERGKIEEHCEWDDEAYDWVVAHQHLTGTAVRGEQLLERHAGRVRSKVKVSMQNRENGY